MIIDGGRSMNEKSVVHIQKGKYIGYGYFEPEFISNDTESLKDCIKSREDNRDIRRIIRSYLVNTKNKNVIVY